MSQDDEDDDLFGDAAMPGGSSTWDWGFLSKGAVYLGTGEELAIWSLELPLKKKLVDGRFVRFEYVFSLDHVLVGHPKHERDPEQGVKPLQTEIPPPPGRAPFAAKLKAFPAAVRAPLAAELKRCEAIDRKPRAAKKRSK